MSSTVFCLNELAKDALRISEPEWDNLVRMAFAIDTDLGCRFTSVKVSAKMLRESLMATVTEDQAEEVAKQMETIPPPPTTGKDLLTTV